jgi:hypothetical protein
MEGSSDEEDGASSLSDSLLELSSLCSESPFAGSEVTMVLAAVGMSPAIGGPVMSKATL